MNLKEIKEMINLMNENNLMELEIEREGMRIKLKRSGGGVAGQGVPMVEYKIEPALVQSPTNVTKESSSPKTSGNTAEIKSPMVGTFYGSPAPDAAPFVQIGSTVEVGKVICVIEAMKLMNEIKAEVRGKVSEILVNNGDPVEYNQPLFLLE